MSASADTSQTYQNRFKHLKEIMTNEDVEFLVLLPGPNLNYLTGLFFDLMERPIVLIIPRSSDPVIILPELEAPKLEEAPYPIRAFPYGEDPSRWIVTFREACKACSLDGKLIAVEPTGFRFLEQRLIKAAAPVSQFSSGEAYLAQLRVQKDEEEIELIRKAIEISQNALEATLPSIKIGKTEREISIELVTQILRAGGDVSVPFPPIVSSGPNSANPHASPTERQLQNGDLLVIDWGAVYHGYTADLTRTFAIGEVDPEMIEIHRIAVEANQAGIAAAGLNVTPEAIDRAARKVITDAGYGPNFFHRTGHGIGMEAHEAPYIREGNTQPLLPGMVFTVEPGIYLIGRNGVRIEDDVVITPTGAECLSSMPRELRYL